MKGLVTGIVKKHRTDDVDSRTLVHEILASNLPAAEKTVDRVFDEVATITGAAFDTTAISLRLILYHIYNNPDVLARLRAELRNATAEKSTERGTIQLLSLTELEQLPFLTACLTEGLRMMPALGTRMARIAPDRDIMYGSWSIPAGTPVGMTTIMMHMDKTIYPEPKQFEPDRWMGKEARQRSEKTYAPFSKGTRICLGMQ